MCAGDSSGSRRPLLTRRTRPSLPQVVTFDAADFGAVVPYALAARPDGARVDLVLAPLSAGGAACRRGDYASRALYVCSTKGGSVTSTPFAAEPRHALGCPTPLRPPRPCLV